MLHPFTELRPIDEHVGVGVFVTRPIERGTVVWVQDVRDVIYTPQHYDRLPRPQRAIADKYAYEDSWGNLVLCWDLARYMNHSCEPATLSLGEYCEIATRDLAIGDQLTCEYGFLNLDEPMLCRCGAPTCRGIIAPGDYAELGHRWEHAVRRLLPSVNLVEQPLWALVEVLQEDIAIQEAILRGDPSILDHDHHLL